MKFYVTTPIYYVNDVPHIGHAYTTVAADVLARWYRLKGADVFFLTGTDEHGAKIAESAAKTGRTPQELCDQNAAAFKEAWERLGIKNDRFIRTTDPKHVSAVQKFIQLLLDKGVICKKSYEGLYCLQCEKFLSEADLNADLCCPDHKTKPVRHAEENYFFKLSAYQEELIRILSDDRNDDLKVFPRERRNEIIGKLKTGLEDISISRAAVAWGIPLPFDPQQTAYVWIDALLNYVTAVGYGTGDSGEFKRYWPADWHLMAKDIIWFHAVIWPAMLLAAGLPLPKKLFAHGFFTIGGEKMSKTLGNVIRPGDLAGRFGVEPARYLLLSLFPFGADGDISWQALTEKYNTDLANNLGNLVSRSLTMLEKFSGGAVPEPNADAKVRPIAGEILKQLTEAETLLEDLEFNRYLSALQVAIDTANRYIENTAPWKMAKEKNADLPAVLFNLVANVKTICRYLIPFMPVTAQTVWERLGESGPLEEDAQRFFSKARSLDACLPRAGNRTTKGGILFPRIDAAK